MNHRRRALAIDSGAGISGVDIALRPGGGRHHQPPATAAGATKLGSGAARDPVEPRVQRTVRAVVGKTAVRAHEHFLGDVLRLVGIVREDQSPAKNGGLKSGDERGERRVVSGGSKRRQLGIECVAGAITVNDGLVVPAFAALALFRKRASVRNK